MRVIVSMPNEPVVSQYLMLWERKPMHGDVIMYCTIA